MANLPTKDALLEDSQYFDRMLSLIPARLYFPKEEDADEEFAKRKKGFLKVSTEKSSKLAKKEARNQALQAKLNPENFKTIPELQKEAARKAEVAAAEPDEESEEAVDQPADVAEAEQPAEPQPAATRAPVSMDELRAKLLQRIEDMRRKRKADEHEVTPDEKAKRKDEKRKKSEEKKKARKLAVGATPKKTEEAASKKVVETEPKEDESSSDGDLKFGTFDFGSGKPVPSYLSKKKSKPTLQQALQRAESDKEKLKELEGTDEGKKMKEDLLWDKAMKRAKGEKMKDDPKRIKAAIKRELKQKAKSATEWKERTASVAKQQADRADKRQRNIDEKLQKRKEKKTGKKKPAGRAGFEGKKRSFLNK